MKRVIHMAVILIFLGSSTFILPRCLLAWPSAIPGLEVKNPALANGAFWVFHLKHGLANGPTHSPKPCCPKKTDAPQDPKRPVSCPLLLNKSQPRATAGLLRTVPDLQPSIHSLDSFPMVPVYHSRIPRADGAPANARSMPIILEKQSFLI